MRLITIAGGGLAGLSLGIALRRREVPVRVVEAAAYPRHRVCGEFISGIKADELAALGIEDLFASAARHHSTMWFDGEMPMLRQDLPEAALGLSRHFLDEALAERFHALGGELRTGERHTLEQPGVVWACGRRKGESPWMGLKGHFHGMDVTSDLEVHLHDRGYVGVTRVEDGLVNVCGLFHRAVPVSSPRDRNPLETAVREAGFVKLAERLAEGVLDPASLKGVNHFALGWQMDRAGSVCIGDAAALIPPFTGNGMTMAFQSALAAVDPLCEWSAGGNAWHHTARLVDHAQHQRFGRRLAWAQLLQRLLMKRRGRRLAAILLRYNCVSFETLYRKVR